MCGETLLQLAKKFSIHKVFIKKLRISASDESFLISSDFEYSEFLKVSIAIFIFTACAPGGGGVHDLRMDGGLPPDFQKGTLF